MPFILYASTPPEWKDAESDQWRNLNTDEQTEMDWQDMLAKKADGSFWSSFEPSNSDDGKKPKAVTTKFTNDAEAWLSTIASLNAEEIEFNQKEAQRADTARQMEEWGFDSTTIASALGIATNTELEKEELEGMKKYREESFWDEIDLETVESHTMVEIDEETGEPLMSQMVYVDEHTCIGCTNCATIAQSTFFMHSEYGRARVFQQWGDDLETIQIAIETCPVDCIHYVPYEELVALEKGRRNQLINFKARLVSQASDGGLSLSHRVGGVNNFSPPQRISGNMKRRCNNCPTRGCKDCPMYGVGKNPIFEQKEKERKERMAKRQLQKQREIDEKSVEL